jgi:signal peptidase I
VTEEVSRPDPDAEPVAGRHEQQKETSFLRWLAETAFLVVIAWGLAFVIRTFVIQPFYIPSGSMEPTLMPGDQVLVNKFVYRFDQPKDGDIVVLHAPAAAGLGSIDLIKRVVGVGGQTVQLRDGHLIVDGRQVSEPYVKSVSSAPFGPVTVAKGTVFLMGDNRPNSRDSRFIGAIPLSSVMGKAFVIYWPLHLQPGQSRSL